MSTFECERVTNVNRMFDTERTVERHFKFNGHIIMVCGTETAMHLRTLPWRRFLVACLGSTEEYLPELERDYPAVEGE